MNIAIAPARTQDDIAAVRTLFTAYAASLPVDLSYQDFATELAALPGKYAPPGGDILLAREAHGIPIGCVAFRPVATDCCEMKRLFLTPAARGTGTGRLLTQSVIAAARDRGYKEIRLDTLPSMTRAIAMYERMGFVPIASYYAPTPEGTLFMALRL